MHISLSGRIHRVMFLVILFDLVHHLYPHIGLGDCTEIAGKIRSNRKQSRHLFVISIEIEDRLIGQASKTRLRDIPPNHLSWVLVVFERRAGLKSLIESIL